MKSTINDRDLSNDGVSCSSLVHIYCGNGKGKTTAAIGLMIRASGSGKKVLFYQFMKDNSSSELKILSQLDNINIIPGPDSVKFSFYMSADEKKQVCQQNNKILKDILKLAIDYDLLVLDEVIYAIKNDLVDEQVIIEFLKNKPDHIEVVLTGQNPSVELQQYADYISKINKIKHPYDKGVPGRIGIEK